MQALNDDVGTPTHATTAAVNRRKSELTARSISRDLKEHTSQIQAFTKWRDEVEHGMASVNKKLDLLLGAILPRSVGQGTCNGEATIATTMHTSGQPAVTDSYLSGEKITNTHEPREVNNTGYTTSEVSEEVCRIVQQGSPKGTTP